MEQNTILIVDDDELMRSLLIEIITPFNLRLITAQRGDQALQLAQQHLPDLILLDVMLPDMNGFEVCQRLRDDPATAQIPIVMITALNDREAKIHGFEAGADEFITKPFDPGELQARINTVLRLNRYWRLLQEQAKVNVERARFEWVIETSDNAYVIIDHDDQIRYANRRARTYLGLTANEQPVRPFRELVTQRYRLVPPEAWEQWPIGAPELLYLVHPETSRSPEQWLQVEAARIHPSDDQIVVTLCDVTQQITLQRDMWTFHTAISHKLRTPLVSYLGGLNLLYDNIEHMDRTMARNIAAIALSAAKRLQQVIDDIFLYVRSPGDIHYDNCTVFDLPAMVSTLNQELEIPAISLSIDPVLDARRLRISRRSLEMVLRELCENARKFHPQQRPMVTIRVDADLAQNQVRLVVCDDGVHLPPAHLQKIWQPYYQAERNFTGQVEGMGLGLVQVARIILAVGGSYQMRNRSDRPGICVELRIPFVEEDSSDRVIG